MAPGSGATNKEWSVQLYRLSATGWVVMRAKTAKGHPKSIKATVSQGSILIPAVNFRFYLTPKEGETTAKEQNINVIRRHQCVLIDKESGATRRTIVLKFQSPQDALEFSDCLVALNPPKKLLEPKNLGENATTGEVTSFVARLMNDPDFLDFVYNLEQTLTDSDDGAQMLQALATSNVDSDGAD